MKEVLINIDKYYKINHNTCAYSSTGQSSRLLSDRWWFESAWAYHTSQSITMVDCFFAKKQLRPLERCSLFREKSCVASTFHGFTNFSKIAQPYRCCSLLQKKFCLANTFLDFFSATAPYSEKVLLCKYFFRVFFCCFSLGE